MVESIADLFIEHYDTMTAEEFISDFIEDLKEYYEDTFLKVCTAE